MRKRPTAIAKSAAAFLLVLGMLALPFAAGTTLSKPENVGISSERLQRLHVTIRRHIEARDFSGAVTLLARKGRVVQFEAQGVTDLES